MSANYDDLIISSLSPKIYAKLTDNVGTTNPVDSGSLGLTLSAAATTFGVTGLTNGDASTAASFNGTNSVVYNTSFANPSWTAITIVAVIKPGAVADNKALASCLDAGWIFELQDDKLRFFPYSNAAAVSSNALSYSSGDTIHVAVTYDASNNWCFYVNGVAHGSGTGTQALVTNEDIYIGYWPGLSWYYNGVMQHCAIASTAASSGTIAALYAEWASAGAPTVSTAVVDENGYDVRVTTDSDVTGRLGLTITVGGSQKTVTSIRTGARKFRLRLANSDGPILSGQTVTIGYDPPASEEIVNGSSEEMATFSGGSVTNNSLQTATTIVQAGITITFGSSFAAGERGITAANRWWFTKDPQSRSPAASGSSTSFRNGSMVNPTSAFSGASYGFDGRAVSTSDANTVSFPVTMSNNDSLVCALSIANETTWSSTTAYTVGQVLKKDTFGSDRYFVCSTAGTSGGAEPTWENKPNEKETITDGSVVWTNHGRTPIEAFVVFTKRDTALAQNEFAPCFSGGSATKTIYDSDDLNLAALPGWSTTVETVSVDTALALVIRPHVEITTSSGGEGQHAWGMPRQYGLWCAQDESYVLGVLSTTTTYATELLHHAIQIGIDRKGMRESGGHWSGMGGHGQGRLGYVLLAGALLGDSTFATTATATGAAGTPNGYAELNQIWYVAATPDISSGRFAYAPGDDFPSAVQGSWLYVPEWGNQHDRDPTLDNKDWEGDSYRTGSVFNSWNVALLLRYLSLETSYNGGAFTDYMLRYRKIQGDAGTALGDKALFDANKTAAYGAFAVTSAILSSGNTKLTITTNRYATGTGSGFALTGGKTLSNFVQLGPRTFRFDVDTAVGTETLSYTQASGDFIDATNTELTAFSGMVPTVMGGANIPIVSGLALELGFD